MQFHKKISSSIEYIQNTFLLESLCFISAAFYQYAPGNFKLVFAGSFVLFLFLLYQLRSFFLSLYLLFFVSSLFITPGKFYSFVVIPAGKIYLEPFASQGVNDGYGFITADFAAVGMLFYFFWWHFRQSKSSLFNYVEKNSLLFTILLSFLCFFVCGIYSSLFLSLFPTFSIINLLQYQKIVIFMLGTIFLLKSTRTGKKDLEKILTGTLLFNFFLATQQFFQQLAGLSSSSLNLSNSVQLDDQSIIPRVWGTFLHANEFAVFILIWFLMLVHLNPKRFLQLKWLIPVFIFITVSQSRSVWIDIMLCLSIFQFSEIKKHFLYFWSHKKELFSKFWLLILGGVIVFTIILGPRLAALRYTLNGGSGAIRIEMINEGWQLLQDSPLFGYGVNTNVMLLYQNFPKGAVMSFPYPVHMGYLQLALEVGMLGLSFFFVPFFYLLWKVLQARKSNSNWILSALITFMMVYYLFQPHGGRIELPLLGIPLAYICFCLTQKKQKTS